MRGFARHRWVASSTVLGLLVATAWGQTAVLVSSSSVGSQGNDDSRFPSISADGRFVAFASYADNLVPGDTNDHVDVFVHDRLTGQTERVSLNSAGEQVNNWSSYPSISGDGRYVAFASLASNLVLQDTNNTYDIFVYDRLTSQVERVSVDSAGQQADGYCRFPAISGDGRYVAFESAATNLVAGDTNGKLDVFVHDRLTHQTSRVSVDSGGGQANGNSQNASISADGRYVAFDSLATNLVVGDANGASDVFLHDRTTGQTIRVSVNTGGVEANGASHSPSVCAAGPVVAFVSAASNLVDADTNGRADVFVRDLAAGSTARVSVNSAGGQADDLSFSCSISADGRRVAFDSNATNLVPADTNNRVDVFLHDRVTGQTRRVSMTSLRQEANDRCQNPSLAADGVSVTYDSFATNLVPDDTNGKVDTFASDLCCVGADLDNDAHVEAADLDMFEACATGPLVALGDPACRLADLDDDGDVDQSDFGLLQECFSD